MLKKIAIKWLFHIILFYSVFRVCYSIRVGETELTIVFMAFIAIILGLMKLDDLGEL